MGPIISKIAKMLVLDVLTDPEKIVKFLFFIFVLPILIFSLVFTVPISLAVSVPTILIDGESSSELIAKQLEILSCYQEAPLTIEESIEEWIKDKEEEYSWCDDIMITNDFTLDWQQIMSLDSVILNQDFNKADANKILKLGEQFMQRNCSTETYIVQVKHTKAIYDENGIKVDTEVWYEDEERTRAIIKVSTKSLDEMYRELNFDTFQQQVASNIYTTISDTYGNFSIIDEAGRNLSNVALDDEKYPLGNLNRLTGDNDINTIFAGRLAALADKYNRNINITSGYRSAQEQQILWDQRKRQYQSEPDSVTVKWVARSGRSRHQYGIAADVSGWIKSLSNKDLIPFGLYKPMIYEDWHIEPIETMKN